MLNEESANRLKLIKWIDKSKLAENETPLDFYIKKEVKSQKCFKIVGGIFALILIALYILLCVRL